MNGRFKTSVRNELRVRSLGKAYDRLELAGLWDGGSSRYLVPDKPMTRTAALRLCFVTRRVE